jgi:hypothetical protein
MAHQYCTIITLSQSNQPAILQLFAANADALGNGPQ